MITAILENRDGAERARAYEATNEAYLVRRPGRGPYLSRLSDVGYDTFSPVDMPGLIGELEALRGTLVEAAHLRHIDDLIGMARACAADESLVLSFTPWPD
jgi:hypothetical protein